MARKKTTKEGLEAILGQKQQSPETATIDGQEYEFQEIDQIEDQDDTKTGDELLNQIEDEELKNLLEKNRVDPKVRRRGRPRKTEEESVWYGNTRATFLLKTELLDKIRAISTKENIEQRKIVEAGLELFVKQYEKQNGELTEKDLDLANNNKRTAFDLLKRKGGNK